MKNILCFGDSNTYAHEPDKSGRFGISERYPDRLKSLLGNEFHIIEEGCPGRTTVFEDTTRLYMKGIDYIIPCVRSHKPLDYIIIILGTNDCKSAYKATAKDIANGITEVVNAIKKILNPYPKIVIVSPIHLGDNVWKFDSEFDQNSVHVSKQLAEEYKIISEMLECLFFNASKISQSSIEDNLHLDKKGMRGGNYAKEEK